MTITIHAHTITLQIQLQNKQKTIIKCNYSTNTNIIQINLQEKIRFFLAFTIRKAKCSTKCILAKASSNVLYDIAWNCMV